MQSGSPPTTPSGRSTHRPTHTTANIIGTVIALLTLILPIVVIAYYTPSSSPELTPARDMKSP
ncbi:MAG: hypothetical protein HC936_11800 [Leptolyngbyaceae cyanobacterium SU_3_3]|nr:hypothetical protein [Leptolyngbyaceae cyanobacterium SU_3_3]NJR50492.1 hypothetical protein [Leptolyngbyaceae cyanobacterium CSU_1_3]